MLSISVCIDVPDLAAGVRFYVEAFGLSRIAEPFPGVARMQGGDIEIDLLEKAPGSRPFAGAAEVRRYDRHWTPIHLDLHVDDLEAAVARAEKAGARKEQVIGDPEHGSIAFMSDPFGHGFCLIEKVG